MKKKITLHMSGSNDLTLLKLNQEEYSSLDHYYSQSDRCLQGSPDAVPRRPRAPISARREPQKMVPRTLSVGGVHRASNRARGDCRAKLGKGSGCTVLLRRLVSMSSSYEPITQKEA